MRALLLGSIVAAACGRSEAPVPAPAPGSGSAIKVDDGKLPARLVCSGRWVGALPPVCDKLGELAKFEVSIHARGAGWDVAIAKPAGTKVTKSEITWSEKAGGCMADLWLEHGTHKVLLTLTNGAEPGTMMHFEKMKRGQIFGEEPPKAHVLTADVDGCPGDAQVTFTPDDGALPAPDPARVKLAGAFAPSVTWESNSCGKQFPDHLAFHLKVDPREHNALRADDLDLLELLGEQTIDETIEPVEDGFSIVQDFIYMGPYYQEDHATLVMTGSTGRIRITRMHRAQNDADGRRCEAYGTLHQR